MSKKGSTRKADRGPEWCVIRRLRDGSICYYFEGNPPGRPPVAWGRESQARRFATQDEAQQMANWMQQSSKIMHFEVARLPPLPKGR